VGEEMKSQDENSTVGKEQGTKLVFPLKLLLTGGSQPVLDLPYWAFSLLLIFSIKSSLVRIYILQIF
jgi:hypothetical protein